MNRRKRRRVPRDKHETNFVRLIDRFFPDVDQIRRHQILLALRALMRVQSKSRSRGGRPSNPYRDQLIDERYDPLMIELHARRRGDAYTEDTDGWLRGWWDRRCDDELARIRIFELLPTQVPDDNERARILRDDDRADWDDDKTELRRIIAKSPIKTAVYPAAAIAPYLHPVRRGHSIGDAVHEFAIFLLSKRYKLTPDEVKHAIDRVSS